MSSKIIFLQHEYAEVFFHEALHPDAEELNRRDNFLFELSQTCQYWRDGSDLVSKIPDIDIAALTV